MKDEIPQQILDYSETMRKKIVDYGFKVAKYALLKLFPNEKIQREEIWAGYEEIAHYAIPVYTIKYKGKILCRRYQEDIEGLRYRFESPIFENNGNQHSTDDAGGTGAVPRVPGRKGKEGSRGKGGGNER